MRISPTLSGLLSEVVYKEEEVFMSDEEASLLQEELNQTSEQIESDSNDLNIVTKSLSRTFEIVNDMQTAIDTDTTDKHTVSLLLSEFASIYKDTLGQPYTYSKNLSDNPHEVKSILTAGLQASTSFIDTLKTLIKKIWESIKAAAKWFWSKVKQFINWIFGKRRKAEKKQENNIAAITLLEAAAKTNNKFKEEINNSDNLPEDVKKDLDVKIEKDMVSNFKDDMKSQGFSENLDGLFKDIVDAFKKMDMLLTSTKITLNRDRAANRVMTNFLDRIKKDKNLSSNISAMSAIFSTSGVFESNEFGSFVKDRLTLSKVLGDAYTKNSYRISDAYKDTDIWRVKIKQAIIQDASLLSDSARSYAVKMVFSSMFDMSHYDQLCGLGSDKGSNKGIVRSLTSYLSGTYSSYSLLFKRINEQTAALDKMLNLPSRGNDSTSEFPDSHMSILKSIDENDIVIEYESFIGKNIASVVAMPAKIFVDENGSVVCNWTNFLISDSVIINNVNLDNFRNSLEKEFNTAQKDREYAIGYNFNTEQAVFKLQTESPTKKIGSSNLEKELIKETDKLQETYEKMFAEVDKYIKWFSEVSVEAINPKRETFNNLFSMVQHLNKITPSLPLNMLKENQLILDSVLDSIDFREEVIKAYKEVLAEENK